jgi:type VI secretion system (T6SS) effector TldE1-like protein
MPWTFDISGGKIYDPAGAFAAPAYSGGNKGQNPDGVDNTADESLKDIGPLPEGLYTFGTPVDHSQLGPFAIPLTPDPSNEMYGRGDFYVHGDTAALNHSASEGCVIAPRSTRNAMWASTDHHLKVVANVAS